MKRILRAICLLMCLMLLPVYAVAEEAQAPAPTVRVLLRRLALTDRADLVLDGLYTVSAGKDTVMSFPKGSEVTVLIREGQLYLFYQGMSLQLGSNVTFVRNERPGETVNGIRFAEGGNLYPGHLNLTLENGMLSDLGDDEQNNLLKKLFKGRDAK